MSSDSDVEMHSVLPKKIMKKPPNSPSIEDKNSESKKTSTKDMIHDALRVLNTRKGVSLYAIKKYVTEQYNVDVNKINYLIKKTIKSELENGNIVQAKGVGVTGSFRLPPKKKVEKKIKKSKPEKIKKPTKSDIKMLSKKVTEKPVKKANIMKTKSAEKPEKTTVDSERKGEKIKKKSLTDKPLKKTAKKIMTKEKAEVKKVKNKMATNAMTPAKKRSAMLKRKSIGSIIKPPKMKPKAR